MRSEQHDEYDDIPADDEVVIFAPFVLAIGVFAIWIVFSVYGLAAGIGLALPIFLFAGAVAGWILLGGLNKS